MAAAEFRALGDYLGSQILGQGSLIEGLLIALLCEGHVLIEGAPGLAKTRAVKALAGAVEGRFARIQFTPDLLPADLTGSEVFHPQDASFVFQPGPLFNHLVLADEINRAPAKVQSALLEAMAEQQITVGKKSWRLPPLFMVAATQNPIEQEGTYPLPEAQLDRFLLKLMVDYPSPAMELAILQLNAGGEQLPPPPLTLSQAALLSARSAVQAVQMQSRLEHYLVQLICATRPGSGLCPELEPLIAVGASPRASIGLARAARARAWLAGRDFVLPEDIQQLAPAVLRHRLIPSYQALADNLDNDTLIARLLDAIPCP
ncbi:MULTISPECIES: MoxR family ATPase [Aeromonas]|uniref:AAA domain-containing protein n=3 Tax=Aeromonas TaxID=642 RepID=A0ABX0CYA0_9GAMM|nr:MULTISPECIES: AAA family ATPase [Aeromonas]AHX60831.1 MoxR-like ATPase [Aeromonas media WS]MCE9956226.1 AAA family ATPase [Aeromonas rivipollensis]MDM5083650.1 AAA family ATPase [Aeromonas rivipollensis]MDM5096028.1 AAA family ATPase [Aeromonas rivipollensis]MDM5104419.1 AAA family ATPase [Aeromonas rivipollensis]